MLPRPVSWLSHAWEMTIAPPAEDWAREAGRGSLRASLRPWHSFLVGLAEVTQVLGVALRSIRILRVHGPGLRTWSPAPLRWSVGKEKGRVTLKNVVEDGCSHAKILHLQILVKHFVWSMVYVNNVVLFKIQVYSSECLIFESSVRVTVVQPLYVCIFVISSTR